MDGCTDYAEKEMYRQSASIPAVLSRSPENCAGGGMECCKRTDCPDWSRDIMASKPEPGRGIGCSAYACKLEPSSPAAFCCRGFLELAVVVQEPVQGTRKSPQLWPRYEALTFLSRSSATVSCLPFRVLCSVY